MRFFILSLLFVFFGFPALAADGEGGFVDVEEASFVEFHDPGWLTLKTDAGDVYTGDFYYKFIEFEDIKDWSDGEKFLIRISDKDGAGIVRKKTGKFYRVFFHQERHPIDVNFQKCEGPTNDCVMTVGAQWETEIRDASERYLGMLETDAQKQAFKATEKPWEEYRKSLTDAYGKTPHYEGGTMGETMAIWLWARLEKSRFYHIVQFFD